jgi:hypothetical protein
MLPMAYAPLPGGEVPPRAFEPTLPQPDQRAVWMSACQAAQGFWATAAADGRISGGFRALCLANSQHLQRLRDRL